MKNIEKPLIWIEISKQALKHNLKIIREKIGPKVILVPCVKGNAYGHGLIGTSLLLPKYGADWLCVNSIEEAEQLRASGIKIPILIIGYIQKTDLRRAIKTAARIFVYNYETVSELKKIGNKIKVHIKVDTGMSRQGILPDQLGDFIKRCKKSNIIIEGIATHFLSCGDSHFKKQFNLFKKIKKDNPAIPIFHCGKSETVFAEPGANFDLVRPGIAVYGYGNKHLMPALSLKTKIAQIKAIPEGQCVGYDCAFKSRRAMKIALLPIGYYDGLNRKLSNRGYVLISGRKAPILGRVCMNSITVDISDMANVAMEDEAVIIGKQKNKFIGAEELAEITGTISYEVLANLRESIPRYYI